MSHSVNTGLSTGDFHTLRVLRNGAMEDSSGKRFKSRCISRCPENTGDTRQFQETSRNRAMAERSKKGSKTWIITDCAVFE